MSCIHMVAFADSSVKGCCACVLGNDEWGMHVRALPNRIGLFGNAAKTLLSVVAFIFDTIFIVQHYILYPEREHAGKEVDEEKNRDFKWAAVHDRSSSINDTEKEPLLG